MNIVWGNSSTRDESYQIELVGGFDPALLYAANNIVEGGRSGVNVGLNSALTWADGNLNALPLFVDPGQRDDNGTPEDASDDVFVIGDYRLLPDSPGIDKGANDVDDPDTDEIETLPQHDPTGLPRIMDGDANGSAVVDIGAYEYLRGDVNNDGQVNILHAILVRNSLGKSWTSDRAARRADVTANGIVNVLDIIAVRNQFGAP